MNAIAAQIRTLLLSAGKTISVAESISAGHLQAALSSVSGASDVFIGGITAYRLPAKVRLLGVDPDLAKKTDCVHEEIAVQMANGALRLFDSDYAIATCGYAERKNASPYAFYAIAAASGNLDFSERVALSGTRIQAQTAAATCALETFVDLLREDIR